MKKNPHTILVNAVEKLAKLKKHVFIWRNNTGAGMMGPRYVTFGLKGSSDFIGLSSDGRFLCLECKTGEARQNYDQKMFQKRIEELGGRYYVVRSIDDAIRILDELEPSLENAM